MEAPVCLQFFLSHFNLTTSLRNVPEWCQSVFPIGRCDLAVVISAFSRDFGSQNFNLAWSVRMDRAPYIWLHKRRAVHFTNTGSDWGSKIEISLKPPGGLVALSEFFLKRINQSSRCSPTIPYSLFSNHFMVSPTNPSLLWSFMSRQRTWLPPNLAPEPKYKQYSSIKT